MSRKKIWAPDRIQTHDLEVASWHSNQLSNSRAHGVGGTDRGRMRWGYSPTIFLLLTCRCIVWFQKIPIPRHHIEDIWKRILPPIWNFQSGWEFPGNFKFSPCWGMDIFCKPHIFKQSYLKLFFTWFLLTCTCVILEGSSCLICLTSTGQLTAFSLPSLTTLMNAECSFLLTDFRYCKHEVQISRYWYLISIYIGSLVNHKAFCPGCKVQLCLDSKPCSQCW